jgi:hypothetical protein
VALVASVVLAGCGGGGGSPLDAVTGEGLAGPPPPRLDLVGLGEPIEVADPACIRAYEVDPGGRSGGQRYHVTLHLDSDVESRDDVVAVLAEETCAEERSTITADVLERLGVVAGDALEFSYLGANGRRVLLD